MLSYINLPLTFRRGGNLPPVGYMLIADGKYYWYGENKEKSISEWEIWHWGVRLYSSNDLYNWTDEGIIMLPTPDKPDNPMHPNSKMDRPHILYNDKTKNTCCG